MPAIIFLNRSWSFASDDFVCSAAFDIVVRLLCLIIMGVPFIVIGNLSLCLPNVVSTAFFGILFSMQFFMIILDLILAILSGRGGTMEVTKRSKVPVVLTILFVLSFVELPIHAVNIYFATTYLATCQKPVIAAYIAGNAIRLFHILQCYIWLGAHFRKSGAFWSRLAYEDRPMLKGSIHHNTNIATKRQAQEMLSNSVRRRLTRLALLGKSKCGQLKHQDADEQMAISSAAALFSEVFYDVNLVVSDIATGLLLLRWQTNQWVGCGHRVPISSIERESVPFDHLARPMDLIGQPFGDSSETNSDTHWLAIAQIRRITQLGVSLYGRLLYLLVSRGRPPSICRWRPLTCTPCKNSSESSDEVQVGCCICADHNCDLVAVLELGDMKPADVVTINFENTVYQSPYFVAVDDHTRSIVIAVRGTLSLQDTIVDLLYDGVHLEEIETLVQTQTGRRPTFIGHRGMVASARKLYQRLIADRLIEVAFERRPGYRLVVCGHSLGAGIASFLSILLRPLYPEVKGYALSSPLGTMNTELAEYAKPFLVSIVYGFDAFARMNIATVMDFKWRLVDALTSCNVPKYRLLSRGAELCLWRCCRRSCSACCCCFFCSNERPTIGQDTRLLNPVTQHRLIHPNPDLFFPDSQPLLSSRPEMGDLEQTTASPKWPSRLLPGPRCLLRWLDPERARLLCAVSSNCPSEETTFSSSPTAPTPPALVPESAELRNGVCGGLVLHIVDVDFSECADPCIPSGDSSPNSVQPEQVPESKFAQVKLTADWVNEEAGCYSSRCEATVAVWTNNDQLQSFLIHPRMFTDHMPHNFLRAVNRLYATTVGDPVFAHPRLKPDEVFRKMR